MKKQQRSKLDSFAEQLDHWLGVERITLAQAVDRLRELGCSISINAVSHWWQARQRRQLQERLLGEITSGARQCREVEQQLARTAPPPLETLLQLQRLMVFQLSTQAGADPELMKLLLDYTLQDRRVVVLEEKLRLLKEENARQEAERSQPKETRCMSPETLKKIQKELKLL